MNILALRRELANSAGCELAVGARRDEQLGAVGEELGRTALIRLNMRLIATDDSVVRLAKRGQRERVGGSPIKDKVDFALRLKKFAKLI